MKFILSRALLVLGALLGSACGGGGGGGDGGDAGGQSTTEITVPTPATAAIIAAGVNITVGNSSEVAAEGLSSTLNGTSGALNTAGMALGAQVDTRADLAAIALRAVRIASAQPRLAVGVALSATEPCLVSGSVTITGNLARDGTLATNDTLAVTFNDCRDPGTVTSGATTILVAGGRLSLAPASYPQRVVLSSVSTNLSTHTLADGRIVTTNGDMVIDVTETSAFTGTVNLLGSVLSRTFSGSVVPSRTVQLKNYRINQVVGDTSTETSITAVVESNNADVDAAGVSYQVTTPTRLVTDAVNIRSGVMKITGNNSALLLSVVSPNNFNLQVDANGDGTYESSRFITQSALNLLL